MQTRHAWVTWIALLTVALGGAPALSAADKPRLIVVLVIDQFPYSLMTRMEPGFGPGGFRRLTADGANFINCRYEHSGTTTGAGHAVLLTGAYANTTGIIDNRWFDRASGKMMYSTADPDSPLVGGDTSEPAVGVGPRNLLTATVGDLLALETHRRAKRFSMSFKDRAAILMAGHSANGVFWFDEHSGRLLTCRHYAAELPAYVRRLNEGHATDAYRTQTWTLLYPPGKYQLVRPDDSPLEQDYAGLGRAFPHSLSKQPPAQYYLALQATPFANDLMMQLARLVIDEEKLGADAVPDLLTINLSANDYAGHIWGTHSLEVQDVTYRTDRWLADFLAYLDEKVGRGRYLFVLSSDHGVAPIPEFAREFGLSMAARSPLAGLKQKLESALRKRFAAPASGADAAGSQPDFVLAAYSDSVYLNREQPRLAGDRFVAAQRAVRDLLIEEPSVAAAYTREQLLSGAVTDRLGRQFALTFHPRRSGDVVFAYVPFVMDLPNYRAHHGTPWDYDTHVAMLFYGTGVRPGRFVRPVSPADIAPTLSAILGIGFPPGCVGQPLPEIVSGRQ